MKRSRLSRLEEKKAKARIAKMLGASILLLLLLIFVGPQLLVRTSLFLENVGQNSPLTTQDTTSPFPPVIETLPEAINVSSITVKGYGEAESTLLLYVNGKKAEEVLIGKDGDFSIGDVTLKTGENEVYAKSEDSDGNTSKKSATHTIFYLKDPPKLEINSPQNGETVNNETIDIEGFTNKGVNLNINQRFVSVSSDGSFRFPIKLNEGENVIKLVATDLAGNTTELEYAITYNR